MFPAAASLLKDAVKTGDKAAKDRQQSLRVLEEDDEFEEFAAEDWDDSDLAHLGGAALGAAKSSGGKLWEEVGTMMDIEDDLSVQSRSELAKTKGPSDAAMETRDA